MAVVVVVVVVNVVDIIQRNFKDPIEPYIASFCGGISKTPLGLNSKN